MSDRCKASTMEDEIQSVLIKIFRNSFRVFSIFQTFYRFLYLLVNFSSILNSLLLVLIDFSIWEAGDNGINTLRTCCLYSVVKKPVHFT